MAKSKTEILNDIQDFVAKHGGNYKQWYIDVSTNPKVDLFKFHRFKKGDKGMFRTALSELQAAEAAEFVMGMGAKGNAEAKPDHVYLYMYKMEKHTKP